MVRAVALIAVTACAGCFPVSYVSRPGATGTILDAATRHPVSTAEVRVFNRNDRDENEGMAHSDGAGAFQIPPRRAVWWRPIFLPADRVAPQAALTVTAPGYRSMTIEFQGDDYTVGEVGLAREGVTQVCFGTPVSPGLGQLAQGRILMALVQFDIGAVVWFVSFATLGWIIKLWSTIDGGLEGPDALSCL